MLAAMKSRNTIWSLALAIGVCQGQAPPPSNTQNVNGTTFLDHDAPIANFFAKTFLKDNIPFIDIPDQNISDVYYYRFSALARHLSYTTPGSGHIITEFVNSVNYADAFGTIDAAAGHQIEEASWLRSSYFAEDYAEIYTKGPGDSRHYTQWILEAALGASNISGNTAFINSQLDGMVRTWHLWDDMFDSDSGLYWYSTNFDAQENSLPGFIQYAANSSNNIEPREGNNTYRPSHNAYMVANARSIAFIASSTGNSSLASEFSQRADALESAMYTGLWNDSQGFFVDRVRPNLPGAGEVLGREAVGFYPFRFGMGLDSNYTNSTIAALFDPNVFRTEYYPTTLEVKNQYYNGDESGCCFWRGINWPFSTAHLAASLAAIYRAGGCTADQYLDLLHNFAITQYKNGVPYIAESHYPSKDGWSQDSPNHSEHYQHSTFASNVISGLLGVVPRADDTLEISPIIPSNWTYFALENFGYHGHLITVLYDKDGSKYNKGSGLTIFVDGIKKHNGPDTKATVALPSIAPLSDEPVDQNIAVNVNAATAGIWPKASASYVGNGDNPDQAIDGIIYYDEAPKSRWTTYGSPNPNDTLTVQLQRPRNLTGVALAIFDDNTTYYYNLNGNSSYQGKVACPARVQITDGAGNVLADEMNFAQSCLPSDINVVKFNGTVLTDTIHMNFFPQSGLAAGVSEVQFWVPANTGPQYLAADALPGAGAQVAFDTESNATSNGAVMTMPQSNSTIAFSGVYSATQRSVTPNLVYKNTGSGPISLGISVNQVSAGNVSLANGAGFQSVDMSSLLLQRGKNFVTLSGGTSGISIEGFSFS